MRRSWPSVTAIGAILLAVLAGSTAGASPAAAEAPANQAIQRTWDRTDNPVLNGQVVRTWMWGPEANTGPLPETYEQSPGKTRIVQYFDKSRMEITHPGGDQSSIWYVTNGLLVIELVTGKLKLGDFDHEFQQHPPSTVNVAGDANDPNGPTYATFQGLMNVAAGPQVQAITQVINRAGTISNDPSKAAYGIPTVHYVSDTQHWVAEPFWEFMTASGIVYQDGAYVEDQLFQNPYYATGFPISEPYWANVKVADVQRDVLVQCFERRCLTYTPSNDPAWRVEMGNVGQHYHHWRYVEIPSSAAVECPDTDPGTYIWVTDPVSNRVQKFTGNGTYLCEINSQNSGTASFIDPWSVAVDPRNNDIWVHTEGWLHRFDYRGIWQASVGQNVLLYEDIAVDSHGNVYGVDAINSRIEKRSPSGNLVMEWGVHGDLAGDLNFPTGIDVDDDGNIYVVDIASHRISMFSPTGAYLHHWGSIDILHAPDAVAVDSNGNTYVTDQSILVFDANGALISTWQATDEWSASMGITIAANGTIYALDRSNSAINYFSADGTRLGGWDDSGDESVVFNDVTSIAAATR